MFFFFIFLSTAAHAQRPVLQRHRSASQHGCHHTSTIRGILPRGTLAPPGSSPAVPKRLRRFSVVVVVHDVQAGWSWRRLPPRPPLGLQVCLTSAGTSRRPHEIFSADSGPCHAAHRQRQLLNHDSALCKLPTNLLEICISRRTVTSIVIPVGWCPSSSPNCL